MFALGPHRAGSPVEGEQGHESVQGARVLLRVTIPETRTIRRFGEGHAALAALNQWGGGGCGGGATVVDLVEFCVPRQ